MERLNSLCLAVILLCYTSRKLKNYTDNQSAASIFFLLVGNSCYFFLFCYFLYRVEKGLVIGVGESILLMWCLLIVLSVNGR